ncbi:hypothetical protein EDD86DRAFT_250593 [Gorgonomyces haynaldii]|nr:hypothetical protein EDD86DRAFT_250593 [Gorgonomyces haynaldii]
MEAIWSSQNCIDAPQLIRPSAQLVANLRVNGDTCDDTLFVRLDAGCCLVDLDKGRAFTRTANTSLPPPEAKGVSYCSFNSTLLRANGLCFERYSCSLDYLTLYADETCTAVQWQQPSTIRPITDTHSVDVQWTTYFPLTRFQPELKSPYEIGSLSSYILALLVSLVVSFALYRKMTAAKNKRKWIWYLSGSVSCILLIIMSLLREYCSTTYFLACLFAELQKLSFNICTLMTVYLNTQNLVELLQLGKIRRYALQLFVATAHMLFSFDNNGPLSLLFTFTRLTEFYWVLALFVVDIMCTLVITRHILIHTSSGVPLSTLRTMMRHDWKFNTLVSLQLLILTVYMTLSCLRQYTIFLENDRNYRAMDAILALLLVMHTCMSIGCCLHFKSIMKDVMAERRKRKQQRKTQKNEPVVVPPPSLQSDRQSDKQTDLIQV